MGTEILLEIVRYLPESIAPLRAPMSSGVVLLTLAVQSPPIADNLPGGIPNTARTTQWLSWNFIADWLISHALISVR